MAAFQRACLNALSPNRFVSQRHHWIHTYRKARGEVAGGPCDSRQADHNRAESQGILRSHAEQLVRHPDANFVLALAH